MPADAAALDRMRALLREGLQEGAVGLSSGLDYPPGSYATTEELAALAEEAGRNGGFYHTHVRYALGDRYLDPFREAIEIGRRAGAPAHITHFYHRETHPGGYEPLLGLVDDARAEGLDVTYDSYPVRVGEHAAPHPAPGLDPGRRARPAQAAPRRADRTRPPPRGARRPRRCLHEPCGLGGPSPRRVPEPRNLRWESRTLADVMHDTGHDAVDAICDLLLDENLAVNQVTSGPWTETLRPFVTHPVGMVGTDSTFVGAKPTPRTYGSFPRILGQFVRDEALLSLEEAVRKMTSAPAAGSASRERGTLRDGATRRRGRLRPGHGSLDRDLRRAAQLPDRDRDGDRQRHAGRGRWRAHRRHAGTRDPPGEGLA